MFYIVIMLVKLSEKFILRYCSLSLKGYILCARPLPNERFY